MRYVNSWNSTAFEKAVEFFRYQGEAPSNSTAFPEKPVEKPVENVENSWGRIGDNIMFSRYVNSFRIFTPVFVCRGPKLSTGKKAPGLVIRPGALVFRWQR